MLVFTIRVELAQGSDPRRDAPVVTIPRAAEATLPWMACSTSQSGGKPGGTERFRSTCLQTVGLPMTRRWSWSILIGTLDLMWRPSEQLRVNLDGVRDGFFLKGGYLFRL
jgi:hypothetical protein